MAAQLKLYVKTWCPWCVAAKEYLDGHGFHYQQIDVLSDRAAYDEMIRLSGQTYTPTLVAHGHVLADFGPEELAPFFNKHNILPNAV